MIPRPGRRSCPASALLVLVVTGFIGSVLGGTFATAGPVGPAYGCAATLSVSADPVAGPTPLVVHFNATLTGTVATYYNWSFGDGTLWNATGPGANTPLHLYSTPATYHVSVRAGTSLCEVNASTSVVAVPGPITLTIQALPLSGTAPLTVHFKAQVSGGTGTYTSAVWQFGDAAVGSGLAVNYTYTNPGAYVAQLNVTDSDAHWAVATATVTVAVAAPSNTNPVASFGRALVPWGLLILGLAAVALGLVVAIIRTHQRSTPDGLSSRTSDPEAPPVAPAPPENAARRESLAEPTDVRVAVVGAPSSSDNHRSLEERPSPRRSVGSGDGERLKMTERVILHIGAQGRLGPDEVAPLSLTQAGMASSLGIGQNSITNVLRRMIAAGVVAHELRHVRGQPRRLRVYRFTGRGEEVYRELRGRAR